MLAPPGHDERVLGAVGEEAFEVTGEVRRFGRFPGSGRGDVADPSGGVTGCGARLVEQVGRGCGDRGERGAAEAGVDQDEHRLGARAEGLLDEGARLESRGLAVCRVAADQRQAAGRRAARVAVAGPVDDQCRFGGVLEGLGEAVGEFADGARSDDGGGCSEVPPQVGDRFGVGLGVVQRGVAGVVVLTDTHSDDVQREGPVGVGHRPPRFWVQPWCRTCAHADLAVPGGHRRGDLAARRRACG